MVVSRSEPLEIIAFYALYPEPGFYVTEDGEASEPEPTLWLEWMGVAGQWQRQGIGARLLKTVMSQAVQIAEAQIEAGREPIADLGLYALTDRSRAWFLSFGFEAMKPGSRHLLLPVATLRQLAISGEPF